MNQQTLFEYLTRTKIPNIPLHNNLPHNKNTRSNAYPPQGVEVTSWIDGITYPIIMHSKFAPLLFSTMVKRREPITPPKNPVRGEEGVKFRILADVVPAIDRALRDIQFPQGYSAMTVGPAENAPLCNGTKPDLMGYTVSGKEPRLPGDIKCSWKWSAKWYNIEPGLTPDDELYRRREFPAVCAQINHYIVTADSRYGYIVTDEEVVPFRKVKGSTEAQIQIVSPGIPLDAHDVEGTFTQTNGEPTPLLVLWYLHMLASEDVAWAAEALSDPEPNHDSSGTYELGMEELS